MANPISRHVPPILPPFFFQQKFSKPIRFYQFLKILSPPHTHYERGEGGFELWGGFKLCMVPLGNRYHGCNRYLAPPCFFYLPYIPVPYFESKYHPIPLSYSISIEVINFNYNCVCRLIK